MVDSEGRVDGVARTVRKRFGAIANYYLRITHNAIELEFLKIEALS